MTVGFLGLGSMGSGMARRLIDSGHTVVVWNRSPEPVAALVEAGAIAAATPEEALRAEVSFSMLANDEAAEAVLGGDAVSAAAGNIHVNMASISQAAADRLEAHFTSAGARYVAAPVLGRPTVAAEGKLNILAAGDPATVDAALPYLSVLGSRVWNLGTRPSMANGVKIAVNYNIIHALQAIGETVAMVERQGVEPELFIDLLTSTLFGGVVYTGYGNQIVRRDYTPPGFRMALGHKDLKLAEEVADAGGVRLASMPALTAVFERALADTELAGYDWAAIAEVSRRDLL
ncbi:NAD(P)-dependent oxidoreductase [Homoserinimonas sp. A447]